MSAWTETTLGEACELYQPQTISSAELVADGTYPVYGANGIIGKYDKFNHEESQLLVTCRGATCGAVNISEPYAWINGNAMVVRPRNDSLDLKYLAHLFRGGLDLTAAITGAAQPQITRQSLAPLRIRIPTLPEQRRIAAILDQAETLQTQRRTALALLDSLTQSLFLDMFGDAETNKMGFQIATLGNAIKLKSGNFLPASQMAEKGQFPVYGGNGINGKHDEFMFEEPKIVIGRVGAYCGCVHVTEQRSWVTDNALYIEAYDSALHPEYLAFALSEAKLNQYASQSGQPLISGTRIATVKLLIPPLPLQQTFATRIAAIEALKATHRRALAALDALFASLQQRAFSGELTLAAPRSLAQSLKQLQQLEASIGQEALIFIAKRMPNGDLYNSLKAIYFADRHHLEHHGRQIYNETYSALTHGPVPQAAYDATNVLIGKLMFSSFDDDAVRAALRRKGDTLTALRDADFSKLSRAVIESLEWGIRYCRDMKFGQTKTASHDSAYERTPKNEAIPLQYVIDTLPPEARQRHWGL